MAILKRLSTPVPELNPKAFTTYCTNHYSSHSRDSGIFSYNRGRGRGKSFPSNNFARGYSNNSGSPSPSIPYFTPSRSYDTSHQLANEPYATSSSSRSQKFNCQICFKLGHTTLEYRNRMNFSYMAKPPPQNWQAMVAHIDYTSSSSNPWTLDTGATNHVTNDLSNLTVHSDFDGS